MMRSSCKVCKELRAGNREVCRSCTLNRLLKAHADFKAVTKLGCETIEERLIAQAHLTIAYAIVKRKLCISSMDGQKLEE